MQRKPVESSLLESIGHEGDTLEVVFKGGKTYRYANVPAELHSEMLAADSVGSFFLNKIKRAADENGEPLFPFTKVVEEEGE